MSITNHPDYPAIKQLAASLYKNEGERGGAAVFVGAGFSRAAALVADGVPKPPLWNDLVIDMQSALGSSASTEPLQLAEEYKAYFGLNALKEVIASKLPDTAYEPGPLYESLLALPWAEVLTTNWDTLLERAASKIHSPVYSLVLQQFDLATKQPPRIAKLHGTINATEHLVFTQEDYRTYSSQNAAFVNFARQVFIENELCLVGFSANDPNFLAWVGWIRDHLNQHAKRIYLVGNLALSAAKRKYFESINIVSIDLHSVVKELDSEAQHEKALVLFLEELRKLTPPKPWKWKPQQVTHTPPINSDVDKAKQSAAQLKASLPMLQKDRRECPHWLVCPQQVRTRLSDQIDLSAFNRKSLSAMDEGDRHQLLYEMAWRSLQSFKPIPPSLIAECLATAKASNSKLSQKQKAEMAIAVIKHLDGYQNDPEQRQQAAEVLQEATTSWPEAQHWLHYLNAWQALEQLNYAALVEQTSCLQAKTPLWRMRKALLLTELGEYTQAEELFGQAYKTLTQQHRNAPNAFGVFSQLAWAHWVYRGVTHTFGSKLDDYPSRYEDKNCSPWTHLEYLRNEVQKEREQVIENARIKPSFPVGHYQPANSSVRFSNAPMLFMFGRTLMQQTGLPVRFRSGNFIVESLSQALHLEELEHDVAWLSWVIRLSAYDGDGLLKTILTPTLIASIKNEYVEQMVQCCQQAIEYWQKKVTTAETEDKIYCRQRLSVLIEVLGRLSIRLEPEKAKEIFSQGLLLCEQASWGTFRAINRLLTSSLTAIPKERQHEVLQVALNIPLLGDIHAPNPVIEWPGERQYGLALDKRIDELICTIGKSLVSSEKALSRLLPLARHNFLTLNEQEKLQTAVWGEKPNYQIPPKVGVYTWELVEYACAEPDKAKQQLTNYFFQQLPTKNNDLIFLRDAVSYALQCQQYPEPEQALDLFGSLVAWREPQDDVIRAFSFGDHKEKSKLIGQLLAYSVVPALPKSALVKKRFDALQAFMEDNKSYLAMSGMIPFAKKTQAMADKVQRFMRLQLHKTDGNAVSLTADAIKFWMQEAPQSAEAKRLVQLMIDMVVAGRKEGLAGMLCAIKGLIEVGKINAKEEAELAESLPIIYANADYAKLDHQTLEAVNAPLVRAECVRLARVLLGRLEQGKETKLLKAMLEQAKSDSLPEVRMV